LDGVLAKFTTHAVAYGSVLWTPGPEGEEALEMLVQAYQKKIKRNVLFTELRNLSNLEAIRPFLRKHNFEYQDHLNYLIELQNSPEAMFQNIGQRTRKNIKRGLKKSEVVIKEATGQKHVDICYELLRQTYRAAGIPLADSSLFQAAFDLLYPKGMIKFTLAYVGENPVAISVELLYKDVIYGWYGGMDRAYSSYVPNELLMWHILRWGAKNGYRLYDFGGCWKP
jgi:lipid II:glycine glycyltransferase (peptidoglycan interpeptide bridge formation enzyme)